MTPINGHGVLLDTNVLSELMRQKPDKNLLTWFAEPDAPFYTSAITRAEVLLGIALLPAGKRRTQLSDAAEQMFKEDFANRCLPFDEEAATEYALLVSARHRAGLPISTEDAQIAAIALRHRLVLATRNVRDFARIHGLKVVNPWD